MVTTLGIWFLGFIQGTNYKHRVSLVILASFEPIINGAILAPPVIASIKSANPIVCIVFNSMHSHDLNQSKPNVDSLNTALFETLIMINTRKTVTLEPLEVTQTSHLQRNNECFGIIDRPCKPCTNAGKETIIVVSRAIFHVDQFRRYIY